MSPAGAEENTIKVYLKTIKRRIEINLDERPTGSTSLINLFEVSNDCLKRSGKFLGVDFRVKSLESTRLYFCGSRRH